MYDTHVTVQSGFKYGCEDKAVVEKTSSSIYVHTEYEEDAHNKKMAALQLLDKALRLSV